MTDPSSRGSDPIVAVAGYHAGVDDIDRVLDVLQEVAGRHPVVTLQLLDASKVYGADHLRQAALLAHRAHARDDGIAEDLGVEVLLHAAAKRQIDKALAFMGLRKGTATVAAVALGPQGDGALEELAHALDWTRDDAVLQGDEDVLDAFGVPQTMRGALPPERWGDLVLERVALLDADR